MCQKRTRPPHTTRVGLSTPQRGSRFSASDGDWQMSSDIRIGADVQVQPATTEQDAGGAGGSFDFYGPHSCGAEFGRWGDLRRQVRARPPWPSSSTLAPIKSGDVLGCDRGRVVLSLRYPPATHSSAEPFAMESSVGTAPSAWASLLRRVSRGAQTCCCE
jgi:hypothetical protein